MQAELDAELEKHNGSEMIIKQLQKAYTKGSKEHESQDKEAQNLAKEMAKFEQERVKFEEKRKFLTDKRKKLEKTIANSGRAAPRPMRRLSSAQATSRYGLRRFLTSSRA